jgi:hypothetical protein
LNTVGIPKAFEFQEIGGEGGIRTHGTREGTPVFKTGAFNRSATSPLRKTSGAGVAPGTGKVYLALREMS